MTTTIQAEALKVGDHIIGDRMYGAGVLDFTVTGIKVRRFEKVNSPEVNVLVMVALESGPYAIERHIAYAGDDKVILSTEGTN